jgi:hypothetical protein
MSSTHDLIDQAAAYDEVGRLAAWNGDKAASLRAYEQALALYEQLGDEIKQLNLLYKVAVMASVQEQYPYAWAMGMRGYELAHKHTNTSLRSGLLNLMEDVSYKHGDPLEWLFFTLERKGELESPTAQANILHRLALTCERSGQPMQAFMYESRYLMLYEFGAESIFQTEQFYQLGEMAARRQEYESARTCYAMALDLATRSEHLLGQIIALSMWATMEDQAQNRSVTCALYELAAIMSHAESAAHLYWYDRIEALEMSISALFRRIGHDS